MNFALGTAIKLLLIYTLKTQATLTMEDAVFFRSVVMVKQDNVSSNEPANIWMDIQKGIYPNISSGDKQIKVGEPITILIYLNDQHKRNIVVDECWAYDKENYDNSTIILQLTIQNSDFRKSILMNELTKKSYSDSQNVTTLLYTNITSFKFPENEYVYITCSVQLCYRSCSEDPKESYFSPKFNITTMGESQTRAVPMDSIKFFFNKLKPPPSYTTESTLNSNCTSKSKHLLCFLNPQPQCSHGSKDPHCLNINKPPTNCHAASQDPKCHIKPPTHCYPGSPDPQCNLNYPPTCYPGSKDNQCQTKPPTDCYAGSQNPQCHIKPPIDCSPGSNDPQCYSNSSVVCYPNSQNPECIVNSTTNCYQGSQNPQCNSSMPSNCYPGSQELHCISNLQPPNCYPGSQNPQCNFNHSRYCHPDSQEPECNFNRPPTCYPGSQNPQCNSGPPLNCKPGSEDPQCNSSSPPNCYPGSQDPRCNFSSPQNCYPGSRDPRCNSKPPHNCFPGSQDPQCNLYIPQCYPGSQNPHCSSSVSPTPICYPGSQSLLCKYIPPCSPNSRNPECNNLIKIPSHCNSSSNDPRCISSLNYSNSLDPRFTTNSSTIHRCLPRNTRHILNMIKPKQPILYFFNILDNKCQHIRKRRSDSIPSSTAHSIEKSALVSDHITIIQPKLASSPDCSSHSTDPRCGININTFLETTTQATVPVVKCVPGLFNRRCISETSTHKKLSYNPFLPPNCYPSSKDPRCKNPVADESDDSVHQSTYRPFKPPNCYPGSKDPGCSRSLNNETLDYM